MKKLKFIEPIQTLDDEALNLIRGGGCGCQSCNHCQCQKNKSESEEKLNIC